MSTQYKSWELPPAAPIPVIPTLSFRDQQMTIVRTIEVLKDMYPSRIARGQATEAAAGMHELCLLACAETLNKLACGEDPRAGVKIRSEAARAELAKCLGPAVRRGSGKRHKRPFDDDLGCVGVST